MIADSEAVGISRSRGLARVLKSVVASKRTDACKPMGAVDVSEILHEITLAKDEWKNACTGFERVSDDEMIDYFTYTIKACEVRYEYYLKKAKELGIKAEPL